MTRERAVLILVGASLIALLIAIASFSLGVYVGVHGWTAGPPSVAGPGRQPKQPAPPPDQGQGPPGAMPPPGDAARPGPRPQLVGRVRSVSGDTITVDTPQGPRLFRLSAEVQVFRAAEGGEQPASLDEVVPGELLAVFGRLEGDGARQLTAERLVLLPPPDAP